jgi:hypothetical protein
MSAQAQTPGAVWSNQQPSSPTLTPTPQQHVKPTTHTHPVSPLTLTVLTRLLLVWVMLATLLALPTGSPTATTAVSWMGAEAGWPSSCARAAPAVVGSWGVAMVG